MCPYVSDYPLPLPQVYTMARGGLEKAYYLKRRLNDQILISIILRSYIKKSIKILVTINPNSSLPFPPMNLIEDNIVKLFYFNWEVLSIKLISYYFQGS